MDEIITTTIAPPDTSMPMQVMFEKSVSGLLRQGKQSTIPDIDGNNGSCFYRLNGLKCGIGFLIEDEFYTPKFEKQAVSSNPVLLSLFDSGVIPSITPNDFYKKYVLLKAIQDVHDTAKPSDWRNDFIKLANDHDLNIDFLKDL